MIIGSLLVDLLASKFNMMVAGHITKKKKLKKIIKVRYCIPAKESFKISFGYIRQPTPDTHLFCFGLSMSDPDSKESGSVAFNPGVLHFRLSLIRIS